MTSEERPPAAPAAERGPAGERPGGDRPGGERPGGERFGGERPGGERFGGDRPGGERFGGDREGGGERPQRPRRFGGRRKVCRFCADHMRGVDYKDIGRLRLYISERGKIEPRRKTGACARHQRAIAAAIKRARHVALLPYTLEHVRETGIFPTRG